MNEAADLLQRGCVCALLLEPSTRLVSQLQPTHWEPSQERSTLTRRGRERGGLADRVWNEE